MIIKIEIIHDSEDEWEVEGKRFKGDELTSSTVEAIKYLQELQQKEMVV